MICYVKNRMYWRFCILYTIWKQDFDGFCQQQSGNCISAQDGLRSVGPFRVFFGASSRDMFDNGRECEPALVPERLVSSHPLASRVGPIH